jgi:hypothetical protein
VEAKVIHRQGLKNELKEVKIGTQKLINQALESLPFYQSSGKTVL